MSRVCVDSCYVLKTLCSEPDSEDVVRLLADHEKVACAAHGRAEVIVALHRKVRAGELGDRDCRQALDRLDVDTALGRLQWLQAGEASHRILIEAYARHDKDLPLRSADALHLACAVEHGFDIIWSSDRQMQAGARAFGIACKRA
jgi:predicted nucleic acid-binding protein